jgi:hypothetical protein
MKPNEELDVEPNKIKYDRLTDSEKALITKNDIVSINQLSRVDDVTVNYVLSRSNTPPYNKVILCDITIDDKKDKCPIYYEIDKTYEEHVLAVPDYVSTEIKEKITEVINRPVNVQETEIY